MKLKSLLLGSAAAMLAGTSSFAADAVVAEPEAVEYVRVCDAYGAGYFFIPGTERCMQLSGEVRFQYQIVDADDALADDVDGDWAYRARFAVRTANESDFGTIRTYMRFEGNVSDPVQASVNIQEMSLDIGGFTAGYTDNYWTTNTGYGILGAVNDGYYGYDQALYVEYNYEVAGFAVTAGVEQTTADNLPTFGNYTFAENPNFYVGANYGGSWGQVGATYYYDQFFDDSSYKLGIDLVPFEGFRAEAFVTFGDGQYARAARGGLAGDYTYGVGAQYTFGQFTPYALYTGTDGVNTDYASVGLVYRPESTQGLVLQAEATFATEDNTAAFGGASVGDDVYTFRLIKSF